MGLNTERRRTYITWRDMKRRCFKATDPNYRYYGARGIEVCDRWLSFENFIEDMGVRPVGMTIDRIDNDGNYEPLNCRWATTVEQNANKRARQSPFGNGVSMRQGRFRAYTYLRSKQISLGTFLTSEEAQQARRSFLSSMGIS